MIRMRLGEAASALGLSAAGEDVSFEGVGTDSRTISAGALFVAVRGPRFDGHDFVEGAWRRGAAAALVERVPDVPIPFIPARDSIRALGELAAAWRNRLGDLLVVGVTGSNGKTTVKEMIAAILRTLGPVSATRGNLNNEIGVPLTLCDFDAGHRAAVVELGANHRGRSLRSPRSSGRRSGSSPSAPRRISRDSGASKASRAPRGSSSSTCRTMPRPSSTPTTPTPACGGGSRDGADASRSAPAPARRCACVPRPVEGRSPWRWTPRSGR